MEQIIRRVDLKTIRHNEACQRLVAFDSQAQEVVEPGLLARLTGSLEYYLVTNSNNPEAVVVRKALPIEIPDFQRNSMMRLSLDYEVRCSPGGEDQLVEGLGPVPHHQQHIDASIRSWILDFARRHALEWQERYSALKLPLYAELQLRASKDFGLDLSARLMLEKRPGRLTIGPRTFTVRVKNTNVLVDVQVEIVLDVERSQELLAYQRNHLAGELEGAVIEQVDLFLADVKLHNLRYNPQHIHDRLAAQLEPLAHEHGRYVSNIAYTCDPEGKALQGVRQFLPHSYDYSSPHPDYPKPIEVRMSYQLELKDLDRYLAAKSPKLEEWMEQNAREVSMEQLFDATYDDLCDHFSEKKTEIQRILRKRAEGIGYRLAQLTTITSHELDKLREPFTVELPNLEFATRSDRPVMARLEVSATLQIPNPATVKKHLLLHKDVLAEIRNEISTRLKKILRTTDPKTFYVDFRVARDGEPALEEKLQQEIAQHLLEQFGAVVTSIHCQPLETPLTERLGILTRSSETFQLEIQPSAGGEEVVFTGRLNILSVHMDGWSKLCEIMPDPQRVLDSVRGFLRSRLSTKSVEELTWLNNLQMQEYLSGKVDEYTKEEFGLCVKIVDWCRKPTRQERARVEAFELSEATRGTIGQIEKATAVELAQRKQAQELDEERRIREQIAKLRAIIETDREAGVKEREKEHREYLATLERELKAIRDKINDRVDASAQHGRRRGFIAADNAASKTAAALRDSADNPEEDTEL